MTSAKIKQFQDDFRAKVGKGLETYLNNNEVTAFINRIEMVVDEEIKSNVTSFRKDELESLQDDALWKAYLEQAYYIIQNTDFDIVSGIDPTNNNYIPIEELRKRAFSPLAKRILTNAGLFYRGISNNRTDDYAYNRRFWR